MKNTFFIKNRKDLLARVAGGLVVVTANGLLQQSGDMTFPFKQDANFYYLTGIGNLNDLVLVIDSSTEFLILPKRSEGENIFGGGINCDDVAKISGISLILEYKEGWAKFRSIQKNHKILNTALPSPKKVVASDSFYTNPARRILVDRLKRINPSVSLVDTRAELMQMRMIKQPEEVQAMKQAIKITGNGISAAKKILSKNLFEYEVLAELDYIFKKNNVNHAFSPIIASGSGACILHKFSNDSKVESNSFLLMDVGAEFSGYCADVSRTYAVGAVTQRHNDVYEAVKRVQDFAIDQIAPNITWRQWIVLVDEFMGQELIKLGLIKKNNRSNVRKYFSHGIGHSLGLDTHDVCDYDTIKENMVITVEPGIYIKEEGIGVRIEDDILVTKEGSINLSADISYQ